MQHRILNICGVLTILLIFSGCATRTPMPFADDSSTYSDANNPIFLMTVTLKNEFKTSYIPSLIVLNVLREGADIKENKLNIIMDKKGKIESKDPNIGNNYLVRMELENGAYTILGAASISFSFPFSGIFYTPLNVNLAVDNAGIYYLGHIEAVVRERAEGEFRAGSALPLLDQTFSGASTGTFDITISDEWESDESTFRENFPALTNVEISKSILPSFDREKAQRLWEGESEEELD